jgi:hypothetical protein
MWFSSDTVALLTGAISHLNGRHLAEVGNAMRELKFKMVRQGTAQSSMFNQGQTKIYCEAFEKYADGVWQEMRRVLEEIGFDAHPGCENDLVSLLTQYLAGAYEADKASMRSLRTLGSHKPEATLEFHYKTVVTRLATEIRIFAKKVRAMKEKEKAEATTQINYYLHGPNSRINIASADHSVNVVTEPELFSKMREAVEAQVSDTINSDERRKPMHSCCQDWNGSRRFSLSIIILPALPVSLGSRTRRGHGCKRHSV